jgi:SAM-dependent methyltransferase
MPSKSTQFTHRDKFSSYMQVVASGLPPAKPGQSALDIPAGCGHMGRVLQELGYEVVNADVNRESAEYHFADMNERLPFEDARFDLVICLEGIEHVLSPYHLIGELARVTRPGGRIVISTPNVATLLSRVYFLMTGTFFQFNPALMVECEPGRTRDRGHISPLPYQNLRYIAQHFGLRVIEVKTDRLKRKVLFPLYLLIGSLGRLWGRRLLAVDQVGGERHSQLYEHLFSTPIVFGRTMIVFLEKRERVS